MARGGTATQQPPPVALADSLSAVLSPPPTAGSRPGHMVTSSLFFLDSQSSLMTCSLSFTVSYFMLFISHYPGSTWSSFSLHFLPAISSLFQYAVLRL